MLLWLTSGLTVFGQALLRERKCERGTSALSDKGHQMPLQRAFTRVGYVVSAFLVEVSLVFQLLGHFTKRK